jgi:nucleoside-diphosphate-sugar epimerase
MNKSISILGCGWLGLPLAKHLISQGYKVKGSTTTEAKLALLKAEGIEPYLININDDAPLNATFFDSEVIIINITSKNLVAYQRLIGYLCQKSVKQVLFISSTSVYDPNSQPVTEETPVNESVISQIEKMFLNNLAFQTTIIRFGGLFGYDRQPGRFFRNGKTVEDADAVVNYIHRDDCIRMIEQVIVQQAWGETFNGVTDTHPTKRDFYKHMSKIIGFDAPIFNSSSTHNSKLVSNEKVKQVLNFKFKVADLMSYQLELNI